MSVNDIVSKLKERSDPKKKEGMMRYGINPDNALGVSMPDINAISKQYKNDHQLALELWETGINEARIVAALIDDKKQVTGEQMEKWVNDLSSWDVCDQLVMKLFDRTPYAWDKACEWADRNEEFVKRAGFAMMASLAIHDKKAPDEAFDKFFEYIINNSDDNRNFVKKAVNWALRQIGKRNHNLRKKALEVSRKILECNTKAGNWIARDAIRELENDKIIARIDRKTKNN